MIIDRASYFDDPAISQSMLKVYDEESPFHFYRKHVVRDVPGLDRNTYRFGRALHALVLEPETFEERYPTFTGEARSNEAKAAKAELERQAAALDGCVVRDVGEPRIDRVRGCAEAIRSNPWAKQLLAGMVLAEAPVRFVCPDSGVECKARFDFVSEIRGALIVADIKKIGAVPKRATLEKQIGSYGYHKQGAFYCTAAEAHFGRKVDDFYMIFVEDQPPHAVAVHVLDAESLAIGDRWRRDTLTDVAMRRTENRWDFQEKPDAIGVDEWTRRKAA